MQDQWSLKLKMGAAVLVGTLVVIAPIVMQLHRLSRLHSDRRHDWCDPVPHTGTSGINVTRGKCVPERWQSGVLAFGVNVLGMIQSVVRYLFLPLAALGPYVAARIDWRVTFLMLATILYYLGPGTVGHAEIRYVLPMHGLLIVFAAVGVGYLIRLIVAKRG